MVVKPSVSGDRVYLVQMLILFLFFIVASFSSVTLVIKFHSLVAKIKFKITFIFAIAIGIFAASDLVTDSCNVSWEYYGMAFSVFTMAVCCGIVGTFLFGRIPIFSEKEEKKAERPDILTVVFVSFLALIPYISAFGVFQVWRNSQVAGLAWIISIILIFFSLVFHGQIMTWRGEKNWSQSVREASVKVLAVNFFLQLPHRMIKFRWLMG